jgi:hypothetical protein
LHIDPAFRRIFIDTILIAAVAIGNLCVAAHLAFEPRNPATGVAVVFLPGTSAASALARATSPGSRFVRYGGYPFIVVVVPDDPGFVNRVAREGALFVLDPQALAACFSAAGNQGKSV